VNGRNLGNAELDFPTTRKLTPNKEEEEKTLEKETPQRDQIERVAW
jgi:hypothetical protein